MGKRGGADGPDMDNRDPKDINEHVKVHFEDVLGEPDGIKSVDCVWKGSYICFNGTLNCCYKFLSILCGIPIACCWGFEFACLACYHIWCYTPMIRWITIDLSNYRRLMTVILESCFGPCCETCGLCLSKIAVRNA